MGERDCSKRLCIEWTRKKLQALGAPEITCLRLGERGGRRTWEAAVWVIERKANRGAHRKERFWKRKLIKMLDSAKVNSGMCYVEEVMPRTLGNAYMTRHGTHPQRAN